MSKHANIESPPEGRGEAEDRLARLLETTDLARVVPHLPAEALYRLIRHRGLEAAADLVAAATPAQLTSLLDLDLCVARRRAATSSSTSTASASGSKCW